MLTKISIKIEAIISPSNLTIYILTYNIVYIMLIYTLCYILICMLIKMGIDTLEINRVMII